MITNRLLNTALIAILFLVAPSGFSQTLEEVVVTAQIREQSLQDVPISVSAIDGEVIEDRSVDNLESLSASVPNFYVAETQIDTTISIRGVRSGANKGFEQSVPLNFDGVTYPRSQLARTPLVDLERVEVLRGPQPTLFGKNAIGGVVSLTSAKPTEEFEGTCRIEKSPIQGQHRDGSERLAQGSGYAQLPLEMARKIGTLGSLCRDWTNISPGKE